MKIIGERCKTKDLQPGDLFSTQDPATWSFRWDPQLVGERVYIRTGAPVPDGQADDELYRITIERAMSEVCGNPMSDQEWRAGFRRHDRCESPVGR